MLLLLRPTVSVLPKIKTFRFTDQKINLVSSSTQQKKFAFTYTQRTVVTKDVL